MAGKFGKHAMQMKIRQKKIDAGPQPPKGFDIRLDQAISELELSPAQIKKLGELTTTRRSGLAHATLGHNVWYRKRQLIEMLNVPQATDVKTLSDIGTITIGYRDVNAVGNINVSNYIADDLEIPANNSKAVVVGD